MPSEYRIIRRETAAALEKAVEAELAQGWTLSGSPILAPEGVWGQAVTRTTAPKTGDVKLREPAIKVPRPGGDR